MLEATEGRALGPAGEADGLRAHNRLAAAGHGLPQPQRHSKMQHVSHTLRSRQTGAPCGPAVKRMGCGRSTTSPPPATASHSHSTTLGPRCSMSTAQLPPVGSPFPPGIPPPWAPTPSLADRPLPPPTPPFWEPASLPFPPRLSSAWPLLPKPSAREPRLDPRGSYFSLVPGAPPEGPSGAACGPEACSVAAGGTLRAWPVTISVPFSRTCSHACTLCLTK